MGNRVHTPRGTPPCAAELRARGEQAWLTNASTTLANTYTALGQRDLALSAYQEALDIGRQIGRLDIQGAALQNIGVLWYISDRDRAAEYFRAAIQVYEQAGPDAEPSLANTLINLGGLEYQAGRQEDGVALIERGEALALKTGYLNAWANATCYLAEVDTERGDVRQARRRLEEALGRFPDLPGNARLLLLKTAGITEYLAGEYARALSAFEALDGFELVQMDRQHLLQMKTDSLAKLGRFEQAYEVAQELLRFNEELYKRERESELLKLEERHQAEAARREAEMRRLEAQAAQREAELKHLENVELQRALESNAVLIQSLRESHLVSETLLGVSQLMQLDLEPPDLARHALALVTRLVDADWCVLARINSNEVHFETVWARDDLSADFAQLTLPRVLGARHPLLQRSARHDEPTFVSGYHHDETAPADLVAAGLCGFASLPVGTALNLTYVLLLGRMECDRQWTPREQRVLGATGRSLRAAIEAQERARRSREAALTDVLTGLPNRRAFEAQLRAATSRETFSVAMLDIDGLKQVNDTRGHAAGDTLLQVFGSNLRANAPQEMQVFRLGGDEIALLIEHDVSTGPELVQADVLEVLDASVRAVRAAGFPESGCSFGVARWPEEARLPVEVVALADGRLYADKQARKARREPAAPPQEAEAVSFGDVVVEVGQGEVRGPLGQLALSPREVEVLRALVSADQQVVLSADLLSAGETEEELATLMSHLRRTLAAVTARAGIRSLASVTAREGVYTIQARGFSLHWYEERGEV